MRPARWGRWARRRVLGAAFGQGALAPRCARPHLYTAEALAIDRPGCCRGDTGSGQSPRDPVPGVRWAACEALAAIGPPAASAVPQLIKALKDEFLFVRICAAGALGSIGLKAGGRDRRAESGRQPIPRCAPKRNGHWSGSRAPQPRDRIVSPASVSRADIGSRDAFRRESERRRIRAILRWTGIRRRAGTSSGTSQLGNETLGRPVVFGDVVYVGTDNSRHMNRCL